MYADCLECKYGPKKCSKFSSSCFYPHPKLVDINKVLTETNCEIETVKFNTKSKNINNDNNINIECVELDSIELDSIDLESICFENEIKKDLDKQIFDKLNDFKLDTYSQSNSNSINNDFDETINKILGI